MKVGDLGILGVPKFPDPPSPPPPPAIMLPQWQPSSSPGMLREFHRSWPLAFVTQHPQWITNALTCYTPKVPRPSCTVDTQLFDTQHFSYLTWDMTNAASGRLTESSTINIKAPPFQTSNYQKPSPHSQKSWKLLVSYRFSTQINPSFSVATCMLTRLESLRGHRCAKVCIFAASWASPARSKASWVDGRTGGNMKGEKFHGNHILGISRLGNARIN